MGRPTLSYTNAGTRLKSKLASELANENNGDTNLLAHAAAVSSKKQNKKDTAFVLKKSHNNTRILNWIEKAIRWSFGLLPGKFTYKTAIHEH